MDGLGVCGCNGPHLELISGRVGVSHVNIVEKLISPNLSPFIKLKEKKDMICYDVKLAI